MKWHLYSFIFNKLFFIFGRESCINVMYLSVCLSSVTSVCVVQSKDVVPVSRYCILALQDIIVLLYLSYVFVCK